MPTATASPAELYFGVPIVKTEKAADGSLLVYGKATDASLDLDDQIVDPDFARKALKEWFQDWANVRQMHSGALPPAGVGIELDDRDDGQWLTSKVYEPGAVQQVENKGYKAYSVGIARPRIVRDAKAPGGRIVDGIVVEVSLVDRPANPSCVFALTKGFGSDLEVVAKTVEPKVTKAKPSDGREGDFPKGTRFAYTDSEGGKHLPIHDEGHVRSALGRFNQTNFESGAHKRRAARAILSAARGHGIDIDEGSAVAQAAKKDKEAKVTQPGVTKSPDRMCTNCGVELGHHDQYCSSCGQAVPDADKAAQPTSDQRPAPQPGEVPYQIRRLHDACCAAYPTQAVMAAYPVLEKNGVAAALGPGARLALWQMLNQEVQEDAGTGTEALDIHHLGEAYKHLGEFIACEAGYPVGADGDAPELVMLAAHSDLHAAFAELNKEIMPDGGPSIPSAAGAGQIQPGQFRRPFLSAGHQRQDGVGASPPNMPGRTHVAAASDFQRPALTGGQERQSPGSGKRAAINAMEQLHDRIALQFPELCPMDLKPAAVPNQDQAIPQRVALAGQPTLTKAEKAARQAEKKIDRAAKKAKRAEKSGVPELVKQIKALEATVEKLSREPDPAAAAHRGTTIVTKAPDAQAHKRAAEEAQARELVSWLEKQAEDGDPHVRMRAQERLATIEKAAQPALTT